jgi:hypothetical protein
VSVEGGYPNQDRVCEGPGACDSPGPAGQPAHLAKRAGLAAAIALVTVNIWTGAPLLALWIGSLAAGEHDLSMLGVSVVVLVFAALAFTSAGVLARLDGIYDELAGRPSDELGPSWLRSMRSPDPRRLTRRTRITALEGIVVLNVYAAVTAFVLWYVFVAARPFAAVL